MSRKRRKKSRAAATPEAAVAAPLATAFGVLATPFTGERPFGNASDEEAGDSGVDAAEEDLRDDDAAGLNLGMDFTGTAAEGSGLDIPDDELLDDAIEDLAEAGDPLDAEAAARAWLQVRVKLKARRIAGLAEDDAVVTEEQAAFERLKTALEADR